MKGIRLVCVLIVLALPLAASAAGAPLSRTSGTVSPSAPRADQDEAPPGSLEVVGHNSLMDRGMNAALAVKGNYVYIGSRTDAKEGNANNAGVFVLDISDPAAPEIVHQIGPPNEGNEGETSRELRIWPEKNLLIVMNLGSNCGEIHACSPNRVDDNFRFYDIGGENAKEPKLLGEYKPTINPHEFYLWDDPKKPGRALLFMSTPGGSAQMLVADISNARNKGKVTELGKWAPILPGGKPQDDGADQRLHSFSVSYDGRLAYIAYLGGGFFVIDVSEFSRGLAKPQVKLVTPLANRVRWGNPGAHTAVPLFGKPYALVSDEVYGEALRALGGHGCPWGWTRMVDIRNLKAPKIVAEYKIEPYNDPAYCQASEPRPTSSFSAHNPTLTKNLVFISWHSGGLQVMDVSDPTKPTQAAEWLPEPLPAVLQEDPVLSSGEDKVVVWSYPVIQDGLIHIVDIRNGYYILRYKGPFEDEVTPVSFLEGNSNLGDTGKLSGGSGGGAPGPRCTMIGNAKRNILNGTNGADVICGKGGNDVVNGRRGNDLIIGGRGADRLSGGPGRDRIRGGKGNDTCVGGPGRDRLRGC